VHGANAITAIHLIQQSTVLFIGTRPIRDTAWLSSSSSSSLSSSVYYAYKAAENFARFARGSGGLAETG